MITRIEKRNNDSHTSYQILLVIQDRHLSKEEQNKINEAIDNISSVLDPIIYKELGINTEIKKPKDSKDA